MTQLRIQFGRMLLDPFTPAGARDLYAVRNHPTVRQFMANAALIPYRAHLEWTRTHLANAADLHLWLVRPDSHSRATGFTQLKLNAQRDTAEIGIMFRQPDHHRLAAALATAVTLHVAYSNLRCTWVTSYVIPSHQHAIDFNLAWGASIVPSDKPHLVLLKMHRDACLANENYRRIMDRLADRLTITPLNSEARMFHNPTDFPFTRILEANTAKITAEAASIRHRMLDWLEKDLHDEGWQVFGLYNFPRGEPLPENIIHCPFTADLLAQHVPTHGAAGFSLLKPRSQIRPHRGYAGNFLRCHLPLVVPQGDCALRVLTETRPWQIGHCLVFDDRDEHEAWNLTDHPRIVLLLDFIPPSP